MDSARPGATFWLLPAMSQVMVMVHVEPRRGYAGFR